MDEAKRVAALKAGDEDAFLELVDELSSSLLRLATIYAGPDAAEEVVQETWLAALRSIDRFEGRSSLKTWLFRILTYTAKSRRFSDRRTIPFSSSPGALEPPEAAVDPDAFQSQHGSMPNHWITFPRGWDIPLEEHVENRETMAVISTALETLPPAQREVVTLRDIEGLSSEEVRNILGLSKANERVLLHRARVKLRRTLAAHLTGDRA